MIAQRVLAMADLLDQAVRMTVYLTDLANFALVNEMVEDWFAALGFSFKQMHIDAKKGVPTVKFDAQFGRPLRIGDTLTQTLQVAQIGDASCNLVHESIVNGAPAARFERPAEVHPPRRFDEPGPVCRGSRRAEPVERH